jgi:hypothetical protein
MRSRSSTSGSAPAAPTRAGRFQRLRQKLVAERGQGPVGQVERGDFLGMTLQQFGMVDEDRQDDDIPRRVLRPSHQRLPSRQGLAGEAQPRALIGEIGPPKPLCRPAGPPAFAGPPARPGQGSSTGARSCRRGSGGGGSRRRCLRSIRAAGAPAPPAVQAYRNAGPPSRAETASRPAAWPPRRPA